MSKAQLPPELRKNVDSMKSLYTKGALIGIIVCIIAPRPSEILFAFKREFGETENTADLLSDGLYTRSNVQIPSIEHNINLAAWKYLPSNVENKPPIIVMAHGLGGQRDFGLHKYADAFSRGGFAVLVFDYRCFGGSDGEPRNLVSPFRQLEDWESAIEFTQSTEMSEHVDPARLILWGSSYSGGHVLSVAARMGSRIKAVVSQVPHLSGRAASTRSTKTRGFLPSLRLLLIGIVDFLGARVGLPPLYVKLAGQPGEATIMALSPTDLRDYLVKHPLNKQGGWQNKVPARFVMDAPRYSPINDIGNVTTPVLFISATKDALCPHEVVQQAADTIPRSEILALETTHFALYLGEVWNTVTSRVVSFMREHTTEIMLAE